MTATETIDKTKRNTNSSPLSKRSKKPSTIRIGTRYRVSRLKGDYDAIVIGSGIGGLTSAASLSAMGKKILVLEQHYTAGGFTHAYSREGYEWDVGIHYIGDVGYPTTTKRLFDFISNGKLQWAPMDSNYDRIFLGEESFNLVAGKQAFFDELAHRFPNENEALNTYLSMIKKVNKSMRLFTLSKLFGPITEKLLTPFIRWRMPSYFNQPTYDVLRSITKNEKLIAVLTGQWGNCGVPPRKSSFLMHSLIARHYLNGGYYPIGGASKIAETIIPQIQSTGGDVFTYAQVKSIVIENGRAVGVKMNDDTSILAPIIISSTGVMNTFNKLLPEDIVKQHGYHQKLKSIKSSCANVGLFIGLKKTANELNLPKTNFWIYRDQHHDKNIATFIDDPSTPLPLVYISFPSAKDPSFEDRYPERATIEIVAPATYEAFEHWKGTTWGKRGSDYEQLSDEFAQKMLEVLYQKLPHLRGEIDYYEVSTPLSTEFFCSYDRGEIYGLEHEPSRFEQDWLKPQTRIPGLWLTGQDIASCGVAGAMIGGFMTALKILKIRKGYQLIKKALSPKKH